MKKTFEEVKQYCIVRAKELAACNEVQSKLENAQSIDEILKIGVDNLSWVSSKNMFKSDIEEYFDKGKLVEFKIANIGDNNAGFRNTGHRNTGDWNTGDWNTGHSNTGLFNRDTPKLRIFEQESEWTYQEWYNSNAFNVSCKLVLTEWIFRI